jgi:hypothetical protein
MTQLEMVLIDGDMASGTWAADVPNPVVGTTAGTTADLYYVIVAEDNDDDMGDCDHLTQAPTTGSYSMTVTNPGGSGGAGICESCSSDIQCGGANDLCVRVGTANESFCLTDCTGAGDCPTDYDCSTDPVASVDGTARRQCVPKSEDCSNPGGIVCTDDGFEDNDTRAQAEANPVLDPGTQNLTACPAVSGDDEDWFKIDVSSDAEVTVSVDGTTASDLDLSLLDAGGSPLEWSMSSSSSESITACLTPGIYYARVFVVSSPVENDYTLTYSQTSMSCGPTCTDDAAEDDDTPMQARPLSFTEVSVGSDGPYISETNAICSGDADYFRVFMENGDTLTIDLLFTHADGDLDLYVYDEDDTHVTSGQGLSVTDDEQVIFTLDDATCTLSSLCPHFIAVKGYNGAENLYDIMIGLEVAN